MPENEVVHNKTRKVSHSVLKSPYRLRDTFAAVAHAAQVDPTTLRVLMSHRLTAHDMTAGDIRPGIDILRAAVEKIVAAPWSGPAALGTFRCPQAPVAQLD